MSNKSSSSSSKSSHSSASLDKLPVKQSKPASKRSSKIEKQSKASKKSQDKPAQKQNNSRKQTLKPNENGNNMKLQNELNDLMNQSSLLLGSINDQLDNNQQFNSNFNNNNYSTNTSKLDVKYSDSIIKIQNINNELDDIVKISGQLAHQFKFKDSYMQVNQNYKTGELRSQQMNVSSIYHNNNKNNDSKSIQASIQQNNRNNVQKQKILSSVTSVVNKVPSENPLSNEVRIIMKHEGIQTDKKELQNNNEMQENNLQSRNQVKRAQSVSQVPKLQLPIQSNDNTAQKQNNQSQQTIQKQNVQQQQPIFYNSYALPPQSRFMNRTPSRINQTFDQMRINKNNSAMSNKSFMNFQQIKRPHLLMQDFYRQNHTNISQIQDTLNQRTLTSNPSYANVYNQNLITQQQQYLQQNQFALSKQQQMQNNNKNNSYSQQQQQQIANYQSYNQAVNPYHHYALLNYNQQQQQLNFNTVSSTGRHSQYNQIPQQINNVNQAMAILMN